jgi:hypothetical protein
MRSKVLVWQDDVESGASWAFELHGEETGHPILVKNLNQPRTLLVEVYHSIANST